MDPDLWLDRWRSGRIAFHRSGINATLRERWADLGIPAQARVFVPLCGKSRDMAWLRSQGHEVLGVELSPIAARDFFAENGLTPERSAHGPFERWHAGGITILTGDFFELSPADLEGVAGVYDRASLIALPPDLRERYASRMRESLPPGARMLLLTLSYPEDEMTGPPYSVTSAEVRRLYARGFDVTLLAQKDALAENPELRQRGLTKLVEEAYRIERDRATLR